MISCGAGMKRSKGEGSYKTLDEALKEGELSRKDFYKACGDLEKEISSSNKRFFELFDLIINQRFKKEEEYKKRISFRT